LDPTGLLRNIYETALAIDSGRKGFAARGKEQEGRINYEDGITSLAKAIRFFVDVFLALETVEGLHYEIAYKTIFHDKDCRVQGFPKDSYHIACHSHKTRLKNILKTPGLDPAWTQYVHVRKSPSQTAACKSFCLAGRVCGEAEEGISEMRCGYEILQ